ERVRRTADLEGSSAVQISRPDDFFAAAHDEFADRAEVWSGELYLEMHRGTYTSQARTKQGNRRSEHLLREAEVWCTTAAVQTGARYPYEDLDRLWKRVLLHQFHDILPGSSIAWVHREAEQAYVEIAEELEGLITTAQTALAGTGKVPVVFNAAGHERHGVPALGARRAKDAGKVKTSHAAKGWTISNGLVTAKINNSGVLTSVVDHAADDDEADREVLAGPGNLLQLHIDTPNQWDAWDVDKFYRHTVSDVTAVDQITEIDNGIKITRTVGDSTLEQTVTLEPGAEQVDFSIDVDWHDRETMLKAGFLLDVHAERSAAETQFGHVFRPTHTNTSWDAAKFEICAQRYLHLAEEGYGVALVNDSTYGHDVTRVEAANGLATEARLSLLRAPLFPDPDADQGRHQMRYSLVVGADLGAAVRQGMAINLPERIVTGSGDSVAPLVSVDNDDIVVSAVKQADDESGDIVVRLYQATGARSRGRLDLGFSAKEVRATDLLERPIGGRGANASSLTEGPSVALRHGGVDLELRPFQMITLRFER
ncbi:MAG: glycosyl hydrolase-related protein, partial [Propionibacteriales bacterium]|nr:glycosyl hydrolase-related protein [Propionibacteriales bacterium]